MRIRATSDLHLTEANAPLVFDLLNELKADSIQHPDGYTVICGDVFDVATAVHAPTLVRLAALLMDFRGQVYVLAGNHDQYSADGATVLQLLRNTRVQPVTGGMQTPIGAMLPYYGDGKWAQHAALAMSWVTGPRPIGQPDAPHLLWCHQGFKGAYVNAMRRDADGVSAADVPEGWLAVSGHYHMPQFVGKRVVYVGSPYQTSFAEEGQDKGWLLWEDATKDLMPQRIPYTTPTPRHHTVRWDPDAGIPALPKIEPGDRVRVVTSAKRARVVEARGQLEFAGLAGVSVIAAPDVGMGRGVIDTTNPREAAEQYARRAAPHLAGALDERAEEWNLWP